MSDSTSCKVLPSANKLLQIIRVQTEITKIGPDLSAVMSLVTQKVLEITNSDGATIELAEGSEMVYRAVSGSLEPYLGLRIPLQGSLSGFCVKTGDILYSEDTCNDDRVDKGAYKKVDAVSMVVVPLKFGEENVGVLKVISSKKSFFEEDSISILSLMAEMMGAAMYHAEYYAIDDLFARATTDIMTGIANRASFFDKLRQLSLNAKQKSSKIGVLMLDMDGLKYINDTFGHKAGDEAIKEFAVRIKSNAREGDIVARLGGDEFAMILPSVKNLSEVNLIIERLNGSFISPLDYEDKSLAIGGSIGHALFPDDTDEMQKLIEIADEQMYRVKKLRKTAR